MKLEVLRISSGEQSTLGVLYVIPEISPLLKRKNMLAFTIEDEHRNVKVFGETRIPEGKYNIKIRTHGGFHEKYSKKFSWHEGMLEIENVPDFKDVLIHIGNSDEDTAGCLLVANSADQNITERGFIGSSTNAYERVYKTILNSLKKGEEVTIEFIDYDFI